MLKILFYLVFILSVAFTSAGIGLAVRLRKEHGQELLSSLLYFQVFIFTFGFYGIWGQVFISSFLSEYISAELLSRFSNIALLMGLPFLIFAWLMLIQFAAGMSGRKPGTRKVIVFLAVNFLILFLLGFLVARRNITDPTQLVRYYFIFANILWSLTASYLIHLPGKRRALIHEHDRRITSPLISIIAAAYCVPVVLYDNEPWLLLIFIFLFFAGNTFLPFYFTYGTLVAAAAKQPGENLSYEQFCSKFEVSPRESEIINEICKGLSNKEIADKLFITLQTVKDHTHRIYIKTNVRSRVQLINLVKEEVKD